MDAVSDYLAASETLQHALGHIPLEAEFLTAAIERVQPNYPGLVFWRAGGVVPCQASGFYRDLVFYFRFRHDHATLTIGRNHVGPGESFPQPDFHLSHENYTGDPDAGILDIDQFVDMFTALMDELLATTALPR